MAQRILALTALNQGTRVEAFGEIVLDRPRDHAGAAPILYPEGHPMREILRDLMFRHGWSTKCRNMDVCRELAARTGAGETILDVGCGQLGLAAFLPDRKFAGVDILPDGVRPQNMSYQQGSITEIPHGDASFRTVTSVDTLEHLTREQRRQGIAELVRVAERTVVLACPTGTNASDSDGWLHSQLLSRGRPIPDWLDEHRANPYPTPDEVRGYFEEAAAKLGKTVSIREVASESVRLMNVVRAAGSRSSILFASASLALGGVYSIVPRPSPDEAYRTIFVVDVRPARKAGVAAAA